MRLFTAPLIALVPLIAQEMPEAAKRGEALFFDAATVSCSTCHRLSDRGTAVGPDLSNIAAVPPKGIKMAILSSRTQYVQEGLVKEGRKEMKLPLMKTAESAPGKLVAWDLSQKPPVKKEFVDKDVIHLRDNASWKHPPESTGFSDSQLADVISYIRWAGIKDAKGVMASDLK